MSDVGAAPVCYRHPHRETYVRCSRCDRPICPECMRDASVGHQCPECVAEGRRTQRRAEGRFGGTSGAGAQGHVTKTLIGINVALLIASALSAVAAGRGGAAGALIGSGSTPLHTWFDLIPQPARVSSDPGRVIAGVSGGDYYRLFTSMFMHFGLIHLALNMWALWIIGRVLEAALGPVRFLALYLLSGLGGSVAVYLFGGPHALTAGASGAIFGLFAALFVVLRRIGGNASSLIPVIVINLVLTFTIPGISIAAHIGGLITGAVVGAGLAYAPRRARNGVQLAVVVGCLVLLTLATVAHTALITS